MTQRVHRIGPHQGYFAAGSGAARRRRTHAGDEGRLSSRTDLTQPVALVGFIHDPSAGAPMGMAPATALWVMVTA